MGTKTLTKENYKEQITKEHFLILYNDEVNTFDYVIDLLMKVCNHDAIQAEQCAMLVHYTGRCTVKKGEYKKLEIMLSILSDSGLTVEIN